MRRIHWYPFLMLLLVARPASALELHWSSGATDLQFTSATRCTLVVQADSTEATLPGQWRLLWLADSSSINVVAIDSLNACLADTAGAYAIDPPSTPADSAAHQATAHFCSAGSSAAITAYFVLDQPGGSQGSLKVVALDPTDPDSIRVIETNEVTCNGGVSGTYAPVILRAGRSHPSSELRIEAVGLGLADAALVEIAAPDTSWRVALDVEASSDTRLTAVARIAADLPPFVLNVGRFSGEVGFASLPADTASLLSVQPACVNQIKEINQTSGEDIQPKDFAIVASRDSFHIFYTRHDYNLSAHPERDEKIIGHKRSRDLYSWFPTEQTMHSVVARPGMWDSAHVWAPSIIKKPSDPTYYMFYTGVYGGGLQRIGVATSLDLNVWTQEATEIYKSSDVYWAQIGTPEFRDPFVMPDPINAGHYLLYFVTKSQDRKRFIVGVATTPPGDPGNLRSWTSPQPLWNTDYAHTGEAVIESPHAFKDPGNRWWLFYTGYNTSSDPAFVSFETNDVSPTNLDTLSWSAPDTLFDFLGGDVTLQYWHASEYYRLAPGYEYLMAFNDGQHSVDIAQVSWHGSHVFALNDSCGPKSVLAVGDRPQLPGIELEVLGRQPSQGSISFRIGQSARMRVELAIFDIAGRRVRTLLDEELAEGAREVRWDGRGGRGEMPGAGVYVARLSAAGDRRITKVVLLR
jgi:hypothetical protein